MNSVNGHGNAFENAAGDVLAAMYFDNKKIASTEYEYGLKPVLFPSQQTGLLFRTMCELDRAGELINDNTILSRIGSTIDAAWLHDLLQVYTPAVGAAFESNCELVRDYGTRASGSRIGKILATQFDDFEGKPTEVIVSQGIDVLSALTTHAKTQSVKANEIAAEFRTFMDTDPTEGISTGIHWIDDLTNGFSKGDMWWVAGAYKMRKTTLMLNMCLHAAKSGASVAFLSREMSKKQVIAQMVSMLAVGDLMTTGEYDSQNSAGQYLNWISGRSLIVARKKYKHWTKRKVEAIDKGIYDFNAFGDHLRIYDSSPENGNLSDIASAQLVIKKDKFLFNSDVMFIDYLQLFDAPGAQLFDKTSYSARAFQQATKQNDVALCIAAQRNEDAIKNSNGSDYSPGIKGGGDPAATADFVMQTLYKFGADADENMLKITMALSRHGSGGGDVNYLAPIHPNSGLLLESDFANKCRKQFDLQFGRKIS